MAPYIQAPTFCRVTRIVVESSKPIGCAPELQARWIYLHGDGEPIALLIMGETDHITVEVTNADQA